MSSRRSRIDIGSGEPDSPAAKRRKLDAALKWAAEAAAKWAPTGITTVFFDDDADTPAHPSKSAAAAPLAEGAAPSVPLGRAQDGTANLGDRGQDDTRTFPLVDYSHDESDDDSSQDGQQQPQPAALASAAATDGPAPEAAAMEPTAAGASGEADPSLDDQLASFMSDLESSGLLGSDEPGSDPSVDTAAASKPAAGAASPATGAGSTPAALATALQPAEADAAGASSATAATDRGGGTSDVTGAGKAVADDGQAEQRVLGPLQGAPAWTEVMDLGSRRIYFWDPETDAVEWDPPPGGIPRDESEVQPAAVATQPAAETAPDAAACAGEAAQPSREAPATAGAGPQGRTAAAGWVPSAQLAASQAVAAPTPMEAGADAQPEAAAAPVSLPSAELAHQTASLVDRLRTAAGGLFAAAPKLVWLAIEAEVRAKDLQLLGDAQRAAAGSGADGLTWQRYERHTAQQLAQLEAELPLAAVEAAQLQAAATAAAQQKPGDGDAATGAPLPDQPALPQEDGLLPPLPDAEPAPPAHKAALVPSADHLEVPLPLEPPPMPPDDQPVPPTEQPPPVPPPVPPLEIDAAAAAQQAAKGQTALAAPPAAAGTAQQAPQPVPLAAIRSAAVTTEETPSEAAAGQRRDSGLEDGELPADALPAAQNGAASAVRPVAGSALPESPPDDSADMEVDEAPPISSAVAPSVQPSPTASQPAASAAALPVAAAAPAAGSAAAAASGSAAGGGGAAPADGSRTTAAHPAPPVAWPMPMGGPMAMPFTWSFYYPPPGYPHPMHAFGAAHAGPHTLPHPAMFAQADALHPAHTASSAPLHGDARTTLAPASLAAQAATAPATDAAAAATPEQRREYRAQPVRAPLANGAAEGEPPLPEPDEPGQPPQPSPAQPSAGQLQPAAKRAKAPVSMGVLSSRKKAKGGGKLPKGASSLIGKWQAVQQDLKAAEAAAQAAEEVAADPHAVERKKLAEAEEWRLQQLRTGQAAANANFQPVGGDWRDKVKAAKKEEKRAKKAARSSAASAAVDLEALTAKLPAGWHAMRDPTSGEVYYGNLKTKETSWEKPT